MGDMQKHNVIPPLSKAMCHSRKTTRKLKDRDIIFYVSNGDRFYSEDCNFTEHWVEMK